MRLIQSPSAEFGKSIGKYHIFFLLINSTFSSHDYISMRIIYLWCFTIIPCCPYLKETKETLKSITAEDFVEGSREILARLHYRYIENYRSIFWSE